MTFSSSTKSELLCSRRLPPREDFSPPLLASSDWVQRGKREAQFSARTAAAGRTYALTATAAALVAADSLARNSIVVAQLFD